MFGRFSNRPESVVGKTCSTLKLCGLCQACLAHSWWTTCFIGKTHVLPLQGGLVGPIEAHGHFWIKKIKIKCYIYKRKCSSQCKTLLHPRSSSRHVSSWAESLASDLADVIGTTLPFPSTLPPSLHPSLAASCDSPALWSIPSEGLMMGPGCMGEVVVVVVVMVGGMVLMWSAQQSIAGENCRLRWLRRHRFCSH